MSNHRPGMKGWLTRLEGKGQRTKTGHSYFVGAKDTLDTKHKYEGPTAQIEWDDVWLHITTDDYEGRVMLNIEALPFLRQALAKIAKASKLSSTNSPGGDA